MGNAIASAALIVFIFGRASGQLTTFEEASVKQNKSTGGRALAEFSPSGERFSAANISLGQPH